MGFLDNCFNEVKQIRDSGDLLHEIAMFNLTNAGIAVNRDTVKRISTVYGCVKVLSETIASTSLKLYKKDNDDNREIAAEHPVHNVISGKPNVFQDKFQFWEGVGWNVALEGNFYALKQKRRDGKIVGLLPIAPYNCAPVQKENYTIGYQVKWPNGKENEYSQEEILHIKGPTRDGYTGLSVIRDHAETFGMADVAKKHTNRFFKNGAKPTGLLSFPVGFKDEDAREQSRKSWDAATGGENTGKTAILEGQAEYKQLTMSNVDAQTLEIMRYSRSEICSIFRVPPHMVADLDKATFSNIEQQSIDFAVFTMLPWFTRIEEAIKCQLLSPAARQSYYAEFNLDSLMRGDAKSRNEALQIQRRNGVISANEWRKLENMNKRTDPAGDEYIVESNMTGSNENAQ